MARALKIIGGFLLVAVGSLLALSLIPSSYAAKAGLTNVFVNTSPVLRAAMEGIAVLAGIALLARGFHSGLEPHVGARVRLELYSRLAPTIAAAGTVASATIIEVLVAKQIVPAPALVLAAVLVLVALLASATSSVYACRGCRRKLVRHAIPTNDLDAFRKAVERADPTAIAGLVALTREGPGKGLAGVGEIELTWCVGCGRAARVGVDGKSCWLIDGDADAVVDHIR
jgi:hypothetical protein